MDIKCNADVNADDYAGTINKARGKPVDEMTDMENLLFEKHIQFGTDYVKKYTSSKIVSDIISMHHEYLDGSGFPSHLISEQIPRHTRIITVVNEFLNHISYEKWRFSPESLLNAGDKMNTLMENRRLDAEIMEMFYKRLEEISGLMESVTSFFPLG